MRVLQMSDLHLEFEDFRPTEDADMLMLNGDICVADILNRTEDSKYFYQKERFLDFFEYCRNKYQYVLYIPGNHESYSGTINNTSSILKNKLEGITVLDDEWVDIEGIRFFGTTLWTDCNHKNPLTEYYLKGYMSDFKIIKYKDGTIYRKLIPSDTADFHARALRRIINNIRSAERVVIMSHHAPSRMSIHGSYSDSMYEQSNFGYYSDLDNFILDNPQIELWTHGHMHNSFDYNIGNTRIVCNPKGYKDENAQGFNRFNILEL